MQFCCLRCNVVLLIQTRPPMLVHLSIGPCMWVALPGQSPVARQPKTVEIVDIGSQAGANSWRGLEQLLETVLL